MLSPLLTLLNSEEGAMSSYSFYKAVHFGQATGSWELSFLNQAQPPKVLREGLVYFQVENLGFIK